MQKIQTDLETWFIDYAFTREFIINKPGWPKSKKVDFVEVITLPSGQTLVGFKELTDEIDIEDESFEKAPIQYAVLEELELTYIP